MRTLRAITTLPPPSRAPWARAGTEPRLEEVLADPLVHQVMRRDHVGEAELRAVIGRAQAPQGRFLLPLHRLTAVGLAIRTLIGLPGQF